jgi:hypothetical protein
MPLNSGDGRGYGPEGRNLCAEARQKPPPPGGEALSRIAPRRRRCRTRATVSELLRSHVKRPGCVSLRAHARQNDDWTGPRLRLSRRERRCVHPLNKSPLNQKVRATIPNEVREIATVGTQNGGRQTVQMCGPPGGLVPKPRSSAPAWPACSGLEPYAIASYFGPVVD